MTIKSLLLGSAAALVAVSGARAADVIMVEPEPVEYVRVCDVYGTGFYYIPGTETCMRLSGYVRLQMNVAGDPVVNAEGDDYEFGTEVRTRLDFDFREETELGLLRAFVRVQSTNDSTSTLNDDFNMEQAYFQLGGLLMGYYDSLWTSSLGGADDSLLTDESLAVGDVNSNQISYTFAAGGFSAIIGLEDDGTGDFAPDVHGKLVYSGAWGGAFINAVYDETFNIEDTDDVGAFQPIFDDEGNIIGFDDDGFIGLPGLEFLEDDGEDGAFALKAGINLENIFTEGSELSIVGSYAFDPTVYSTIDGLGNAFSAGADDGATLINPTPGAQTLFLEWAIGAGYSQEVGDFTVAVSGQYGETFDTAFVTGIDDDGFLFDETSGEYYSLIGDIGYDFTDNFGALAEIQYTNVDFDELGEVDQTKGFLRFVRSF